MKREELAALSDSGVKYIFAQFTDIHGILRGKLLPLNQLNTVLDTGAGFSGPSIWGTGLPRFGASSEYYGRGDLSAVSALSWRPDTVRLVCDGYVAGAPFALCPRQILRRQMAKLSTAGFIANAGIEPEFFLLQADTAGNYQVDDAFDDTPKPSYDSKVLFRHMDFLAELHQALTLGGLDVLQIDHEDSVSQYEVNFRYRDALGAADDVMFFKMAANAIAEKHNRIFSMMPKPFADRPGSGLHFHLSLVSRDNKQAFVASDNDQGNYQLGLSKMGEHFAAGLLAHAEALCAICAPTVNSYKRLQFRGSQSGSTWAPVWISYGDNNRTALLRVVDGRLEWRLPDSSTNPYLALAAVLAAGMDGVNRKLDPGQPCNHDISLSPVDNNGKPLRRLPENLAQALTALGQNEVIVETLGKPLVEEFIALKSAEFQEFTGTIHAWEMKQYARLF